MNEKEAREIIKKYDEAITGTIIPCEDPSKFDEWIGRCRGYLEAIEKARALEEALDNLQGWFDGHSIKLSGDYPVLNSFLKEAKETLAKWEKDR